MKISTADKVAIRRQFERILKPSKVVDIAIDTKRMVAYAAVAFYGNDRGNYFLHDSEVYGIAAQIFERGNFDWDKFTITSDEMPSETEGIAHMERYCHCPLRLLKRLSPAKNDWAQEWRVVCRKNASRKTK